jgi:flagellar biosynthesis/type III secretory pathway M-ring protein FliF/YscJ
VGTAAFYLNRPAYQPIYVGLERDDVTRMGMALADAGILTTSTPTATRSSCRPARPAARG